MSQASRLAQQLLQQQGGVGAALDVQRQQIGGYDVQRQQIGNPAMLQEGQIQDKAVRYSPAAYGAGGLTWLGFGATVIAAGATNFPVDIETLRPFTPQLVMLPSTVIGLLITQVQLEGTNLFANVAGIPVELWSEVSNAPQIEWPTLDTSTGVTLLLSNPTGAPLTFSGGFWGTQIRR